MALQFEDIEFEAVCAELKTPDLEGFDFFTESHGVKIYRQYNETTKLYKYKIYGTLEGVSPEICAQVYMDLEYRKSWDTYVKELKEVEDGEDKVVYWQVNFPFPMSNRDYVYKRELRQLTQDGNDVWVVLASAHKMDSIKEQSGVVRVTEYISYSALMADGKGGTKAYMHYYDNPGGSIPTWLINWAASHGVPGFLGQMETACKGYPEYLKTKSS